MDLLNDEDSEKIEKLKIIQSKIYEVQAKILLDKHRIEVVHHKLRIKEVRRQRYLFINGLQDPDITEDNNPVKKYCHSLLYGSKECVRNCRSSYRSTSSGLPHFWLSVFKATDEIKYLIKPHDEPVLRCLQDVRVELSDDFVGFTLNFIFGDNKYFHNTSLQKKYFYDFSTDINNPVKYQENRICKSEGCKIFWKRRNGNSCIAAPSTSRAPAEGVSQHMERLFQNNSFFEFFNPLQVPENENVSELYKELLKKDFELGALLKEKVIPHAVLYITGDIANPTEYTYPEDDEEE